MNDITTLGGITLNLDSFHWGSWVGGPAVVLAVAALIFTVGEAVQREWKLFFIFLAVLLVAGPVGVVGIVSSQTFNDDRAANNQKSVIEWADDRYDVDLSKQAADLLIDGDTVAVDGAGVKLTVGQDDGYYLLNVKGLVELPVK